MAAYSAQDTNQQPIKALPGALRSGPNPAGAPDAYEAGTVFGVSRTPRYKAFTNPFVGRPTVILTPLTGGVGTVIPMLAGTPNLGSFKVRNLTAPAGGSVQLHYIAIGQR